MPSLHPAALTWLGFQGSPAATRWGNIRGSTQGQQPPPCHPRNSPASPGCCWSFHSSPEMLVLWPQAMFRKFRHLPVPSGFQ